MGAAASSYPADALIPRLLAACVFLARRWDSSVLTGLPVCKLTLVELDPPLLARMEAGGVDVLGVDVPVPEVAKHAPVVAGPRM